MTMKQSKKTAKATKATKPAKATKKAKAVAAKPVEAKATKMSGLDAAARVLKESGEAMNAKAMVETMLAKGYWTTGGRTPSATIYAAVIREIAAKKADSRFKKTDRGLFTFNS
ncbi:MAG: winged helix-turn-helix domain-containing protein [Phycisphaerales bacterium]|nr:winged helix-turn-helix domain-containing protein [Phycisphaerales bacterium]